MGWKAAQKLIHHWRILRGDNVMIIRGKDKGESGIIKRVIRSQNRVIVEGKNLVKKHIKQGQGHEGGIFSVEAPLHVSNVQVVDPATGKPCKVGIRYLDDGTKVRVSRGIGASGSIIPRPEILKIRTTPRPTVGGYGVLWSRGEYTSVCLCEAHVGVTLRPFVAHVQSVNHAESHGRLSASVHPLFGLSANHEFK